MTNNKSSIAFCRRAPDKNKSHFKHFIPCLFYSIRYWAHYRQMKMESNHLHSFSSYIHFVSFPFIKQKNKEKQSAKHNFRFKDLYWKHSDKYGQFAKWILPEETSGFKVKLNRLEKNKKLNSTHKKNKKHKKLHMILQKRKAETTCNHRNNWKGLRGEIIMGHKQILSLREQTTPKIPNGNIYSGWESSKNHRM